MKEKIFTEKTYEATTSNNYTIRTANNNPDVAELIKEGSGQYNALHEAGGECFDNSFSAFIATGVGDTITFEVTDCGEKIECVATDNGPGIADIDQAITYGSKKGQQTVMNSHGFGPGQMDAEDMSLQSTFNGHSVSVKAPFVPGVKIKEYKKTLADLPHGVRWKFRLDVDYLRNECMRHADEHGAPYTEDFMLLCAYLAENLGFVYHPILLKHPNYRIIVIAHSNNTTKTFTVEPLYPVFQKDKKEGTYQYTEVTRKVKAYHNMPGYIILNGRVGYAVPNRPSLLGYFAKAQESQCWYSTLGDRVIARTQALSGTNKVHPDFNGMMGIVHIEAETAAHAPRTTVSKTGFANKDATTFKKQIYRLVPGLTQKLKKYKSKDCLHDAICENIANAMEKNGDDVQREHMPTTDTKEELDIINFSKGVGYEIKPRVASVADVNQANGYIQTLLASATVMEPCPISVMYLCATSFPEEVMNKIAISNRFLEAAHVGVRIETINLHHMPEAKFRETQAEFRKKNKQVSAE